MKKVFKLICIAIPLMTGLGSQAHAQEIDYVQDIKIPEALPEPGTMPTSKHIYYLKTPNAFSPQVLDTAASRLKFPTGKPETTVFVQFKSASVTSIITEQLKMRGVTIAQAQDKATFILRGDIGYSSQYVPNPPQRLVLNQQFDLSNAPTTAAVKDPSNKTLSAAAFDLAPSYAARALNPGELGASALMALFNVTGLANAFSEKKTEEQKRAEVFVNFDCFDQKTRAAGSCMSDSHRLTSYRNKVRVEAVDLRAYLICNGSDCGDHQRVRIISRQIAGRHTTDVNLLGLLMDGIGELVTSFGEVKAPAEKPEVASE